MPKSAIVPVRELSELVNPIATVIAETIKLLVQRPERVVMVARISEGQATLSVQVAANDLGQVLGKQGRTVRSLRTLLYSITRRSNLNISLDIRSEDL
jgi:predicted RNA-binding protein YlqC (UPF0109 family)